MQKEYYNKKIYLGTHGYPCVNINKIPVMIHRLILEPYLKILKTRFPNIRWIVHHKDGNKLNFKKNNLQIMTASEHNKLHFKGNPDLIGKKKHSVKNRKKLSKIHRGKSLFNFTSAHLAKNRNALNKKGDPNKIWRCVISHNNKLKSLGNFQDPLSCNIVHDLVKEFIYEAAEW